MASGPSNTIEDVAGVRVGHATWNDPGRGICTGVTAVIPAPDVLSAPVAAAVHVINGYGKSTGLMQVAELGELETPIVLTGVFGVPSVWTAVLSWLMRADPSIGDAASGRSVNCLVMECNDAHMNDPRAGVAGADLVEAAFRDAGWPDPTRPVEPRPDGHTLPLGTVGAGTGMATFGYAGAIGSASRRWRQPDGTDATVGVLVLSNYGKADELVIAGVPMPPEEDDGAGPGRTGDGSVIVLIATDLPLAQAPLARVARRAQNAMARTGGITASGSGEVVVAFSTSRAPYVRLDRGQDQLDVVFRATAEAVEDAVLSGLLSAHDVSGRDGRRQRAFPARRLSVLADRTDGGRG